MCYQKRKQTLLLTYQKGFKWKRENQSIKVEHKNNKTLMRQ